MFVNLEAPTLLTCFIPPSATQSSTGKSPAHSTVTVPQKEKWTAKNASWGRDSGGCKFFGPAALPTDFYGFSSALLWGVNLGKMYGSKLPVPSPPIFVTFTGAIRTDGDSPFRKDTMDSTTAVVRLYSCVKKNEGLDLVPISPDQERLMSLRHTGRNEYSALLNMLPKNMVSGCKFFKFKSKKLELELEF
ncbi:hypothetical protein C8R45DRAFT_946955 [Mycena sanguinolenta]|nr:hypothetical protein C8R45DRAFT_946955 [Mycena sanguinolenta]